MTDQEAFEAWRNKTKQLPGVSEWDARQAAITHVKATYVLCEKKPITSQLQQDFETGVITSYPLYREAK